MPRTSLRWTPVWAWTTGPMRLARTSSWAFIQPGSAIPCTPTTTTRFALWAASTTAWASPAVRGYGVPVALELQDGVDVGLGPAAAAEEGDPESAVGPGHLGVADGRQGQGGADSGP